MLKLKQNQKRQPIGGHHYTEYGVTFRGETFQEVVKKLSQFRINNHIAFGNPARDVLMFYASHWPWMVESGEEFTEGPTSDNYQKWRAWIDKLWFNPPKAFINNKEARARCETCRACPFNAKKDWAETQESAELTRRAFMLRRGIDAPDYVGFCSLHNADISVLSFLDQPKEFSSAAKDSGSKEGCWVALAGHE